MIGEIRQLAKGNMTAADKAREFFGEALECFMKLLEMEDIIPFF